MNVSKAGDIPFLILIKILYKQSITVNTSAGRVIGQLGERQTEDLKVACSIHAHRNLSFLTNLHYLPFYFSIFYEAHHQFVFFIFFTLDNIWCIFFELF